MYIYNGGSGIFTRVLFKGNTATSPDVGQTLLLLKLYIYGACVYIHSVYIYIIYTISLFFLCFSLIYEQYGNGGGAVYIQGSSSSVTFISCSWSGNTATKEVRNISRYIIKFPIFPILIPYMSNSKKNNYELIYKINNKGHPLCNHSHC